MPDEIRQAIEYIDELPPYVLIGIFVVFVLLIIGLGRIVKKPPARLTAFSSDTGSVQVSRKALQDLIKQACLKDEATLTARPTVKIKGSKIDTNVDLRLASPSNLKQTSERLQNRISELLRKSLNFDQIGKIEIVVSSFGKSDVDEEPPTEASATIKPSSSKNAEPEKPEQT